MERLSQLERSLLSDLAVFAPKPNTFSEQAVYTICGLETEIFFASLDGLCDAGLVESLAPGRYMLHQTIVDYARISLPSGRKTIHELKCMSEKESH